MLRENLRVDVLSVHVRTMRKHNHVHTLERSVQQEALEILELPILPLIPWLSAPFDSAKELASLNGQGLYRAWYSLR